MNETDLNSQEPIEGSASAVTVTQWLSRIPYARFMDVQVHEAAEGLSFVLAPHRHNVGNPALPALHGGVIAAFMETCAVLDVMAHTGGRQVPRVVDFSIDYLRSGQLKPTYARCQMNRLGRRVVNVSITAWQTDESKPITMARAHLIWPEA